MKCRRFLVLLLAWAGASGPAPLRAQSNPPFQNPSLDSNCYFPQIGVPGEIDTIYGSQSGQGLGTFIHNLGPKPDGTPGNMLIGNTGPNNSIGETTDIFVTAATGPNFSLHDLKAKAQAFLPDNTSLRFGHFHNSTSLDIFDAHNWKIYWADDNGDYDSTRFTKLKSNILGNQGTGILGVEDEGFTTYLAHLISDTVDDIVMGIGTQNSQLTQDSLYLILFRGGTALANEAVAYEDTSLICGSYLQIYPYPCVQGDFRGTGREDLIMTDDHADVFFFKNDPPFSLQSLKTALLFDTLWAKPLNFAGGAIIWPDPVHESLSMHALPKKHGDNSFDWVIPIPLAGDSNNTIFIFRGGPDFGSHRITVDSAAFVILPPTTLDEPNWPGQFMDAGDMTGTGNRVFYTLGADDTYAYQNFYVTGQALDQKIDIYNFATAGAFGDTLTANDDSLEDFLMGLPGYASENDKSNGITGVGSMWLMYGSKNIPVHLNPQFADVKSIPQENGAGITLSPNPTQLWSVATIVWPEAEEADCIVYNLLGIAVQTGKIRLLGGPEQQRIYFSNLASGVYEVVIRGVAGEAHAKLVIIR